MSLRDAIAELVRDGDTVALEGFTHLIPFAAGHEVIRQGRTDLTLVRMTPDVIYDQLIGAGAARRLVFSWGGNPGVGSLHRLRDAVEHGWPRPLELAEYSHAMMCASYVAGASGLPFGVLRAGTGTSLPAHNPDIRSTPCPFTNEILTAVKALRPDVTVIHAQRADRAGNVQLWGIIGIQKEAVYSARRSLVTVEEIVDALEPKPGAVILPAGTLTAISHAPGGARPSYAHDHYARDNAAYLAWDAVSRSRDRFGEWLKDLRAAS
jgi:glutaconate CoA-transferase subunit A